MRQKLLQLQEMAATSSDVANGDASAFSQGFVAGHLGNILTQEQYQNLKGK